MPDTDEWRFPNAATPPGSGAYYALRFSPAATRDLHAMLLAWHTRIIAIAEAPTDPGVARLKLDWWRSEIGEALADKTGSVRHPLMQALRTAGLDPSAGPAMRRVVDVAEQMVRRPVPNGLDEFEAHCQASGGGLFQLLCAPQPPSAYNAARCEALGGYYAAVSWLCGLHGPRLPQGFVADAQDGVVAIEDRLRRLENATRPARDEPVPDTAQRLTAIARGLHRQLARQDYRTGGPAVSRPPIAHLWAAWRRRAMR
jgi:phytoene synthase